MKGKVIKMKSKSINWKFLLCFTVPYIIFTILMLPVMKDIGYDKELATGLLFGLGGMSLLVISALKKFKDKEMESYHKASIIIGLPITVFISITLLIKIVSYYF